MTGTNASGARGIAITLALAGLAVACDAPKRAPLDERSSTRPEAPRGDLSVVDAASRLADDGDYIAAHAALEAVPPESEALDDPRVARIEAGWAVTIFQRVLSESPTDGGRADLERVAAAPRVPADLKVQALEKLSKLDASRMKPVSSAPLALGGAGFNAVAGGNVAGASSVIAGLAPKFRRCYTAALANDPTIQGTIRVTAKLGPTGEPLGTSSTQTGTLPATVADCVKTVIMGAQFAAPEGGGATLVIPVTFQPQ